jgi:hypothetical protein
MIAGESDLNDVAIYWPRDGRKLAAIKRSGRCPSHSVPRKLKVPGGLVALVDESGEVMLLFRIQRVEEGVPVKAPNGESYASGCVLVARKRTMRKPTARDPKYLNVNRYALGAFAYFDSETHERVVYELGPGERPGPSLTTGKPFPARHYPFFADNVGKTLNQPERKLIQAYARWVGDFTMFVHHALKNTGLYTDLFIPRCWTLLEAKSNINRRTLREAIGQLFDYQRFYTRSPRLAVLLPQRPSEELMALFEKKHIVVVWRSRGGSFRDSADGVLTTALRELVG